MYMDIIPSKNTTLRFSFKLFEILCLDDTDFDSV